MKRVFISLHKVKLLIIQAILFEMRKLICLSGNCVLAKPVGVTTVIEQITLNSTTSLLVFLLIALIFKRKPDMILLKLILFFQQPSDSCVSSEPLFSEFDLIDTDILFKLLVFFLTLDDVSDWL